MAKIVHFEIPVDDLQRGTAFYREVLGWEISRGDDQPYWLARAGEHDEPGADGALLHRNGLHASPIPIVEVNDLDTALQRARSLGARVVQTKTPVPGRGWVAYLVDPERNTLGFVQPEDFPED